MYDRSRRDPTDSELVTTFQQSDWTEWTALSRGERDRSQGQAVPQQDSINKPQTENQFRACAPYLIVPYRNGTCAPDLGMQLPYLQVYESFTPLPRYIVLTYTLCPVSVDGSHSRALPSNIDLPDLHAFAVHACASPSPSYVP